MFSPQTVTSIVQPLYRPVRLPLRPWRATSPSMGEGHTPPVLRMLAVGLGECGRHWVGGMLPQVPEVQLAGCVDLDPAALGLAVERLGVPAGRCFTSLPAALAETAPDAVLVATTLPGHVPVARAALEAGCHVLLEKPFAASLAEARGLVALAGERRRVLMINQNYRFFPAPRAAAELVRGGRLG